MTTHSQKTRLHLKSETVPLHSVIAPDDAPACYGDYRTRCFARICGACPSESLCADFVDREQRESALGLQPERQSDARSVWPPEAPLILDIPTFRESCWNVYDREPTLEERELRQLLPSGSTVANSLSRAARCCCNGGLLTLAEAVEIAILAYRFERWLQYSDGAYGRVNDCATTAKIWFAVEVTRRALRGQGRPQAFSVEFVHEAWRGLFEEKRSLKSLARRWERDLGLFREFWSLGRK